MLSASRLNAHVARMGQDAMWRRAFACPCASADSGQAKFNCPLCSGKGWTWAAAVQVRIGMTAQSSNKIMAQFGVFESGDTLITLPSNSAAYDAGRFDRFLALNSTNHFSELLTRGQDDRLLGAVQAFTRCYWLNAGGSQEIDGGLPVADANGNLTWPNNDGPPAGQMYSLSGTRFDEFYVFPAMPADRNQLGGTAFPRKVLGRKFDLFGR